MTTNANRADWFIIPKPVRNARLRLICFPYAGGGSMIYRSWAEHLPEEVELCCAQLPGRESRIREPFFDRVRPLVEASAEAMLPYLDKPFALFGHSMGALISFELTRVLKEKYDKQPMGLFVSARRAPQVPSNETPMHNLPDDEFLEELARLNGTPQEVLDNPELLEMIQPLLRADFAVCETYQYEPGAALDCPLFAFGGLKDLEVGREKLEPWREHTSAYFVLRMLPGDHFFLHSSKRLLIQMVSHELLHLLRSGRC